MSTARDALKITAATDLSPRSDRAFERAVLISRSMDAHLTLLHVVDDEYPSHAQRAVVDEAEAFLTAEIGKVRSVHLTNAEFAVALGRDYETIIEQARKDSAALIVMGTHRKTLLREHWFGTTVDHVVRHSDIPVLVVREKPFKQYERILVPVDFSEASKHALEAAIRLFPAAKFTVLHAWDVPFKGFMSDQGTRTQYENEQEGQMTTFVRSVLSGLADDTRQVTCEMTPILRQGSPANVVHAFMKEIEPDLVVLGTHGASGFRAAVIGSVAEHLISTLEGDVLVVRPPIATT